MDVSQKFDKKWGVEHRYGPKSIFQKMELRLSYFDATYKTLKKSCFQIIISLSPHFDDSFYVSNVYTFGIQTKCVQGFPPISLHHSTT